MADCVSSIHLLQHPIKILFVLVVQQNENQREKRNFSKLEILEYLSCFP
jgi:hypothetical protein